MGIDQLLKRYFGVAILPVLAAVAWLDARALGAATGIVVAPEEKQLTQAPAAARVITTSTATPRATTGEAILNRNPFDHETGPLKPPPVVAGEETASGPVDDSDPMTAPACDGVKIMVIAASTDPEWSFAAMMGSGEAKSVLRRRGMTFGSKKVRFIGWDRVWFENGSSLCQAELFRGPDAPPISAAPATSAAPTSTTPTRGAPSISPDMAKGIVRVSATEFNIDRGVVDKILENQADLMRQARVVPEQENGKTVGVRMYGIRPDTLLGTLGMQNGDRLQSINGFEMSDPSKALEAYARLRTADKLSISLNRGGQPLNLDYNIK